MKNIFLLIAILTFTNVFAIPSKLDDIHKALIFISPPRAGTHITNLAIQLFSKRPYYRICENKSYLMKNIRHCDLQPNYNKRPYFHTHFVNNLTTIDRNSNQLLLVLRNPKELIIRYAKSKLSKQNIDFSTLEAQEFITQKLSTLESYDFVLGILDFYDKWPINQRFIITYEDLIEQTQSTIESLIEFLGENKANVSQQLSIFKKLNTQMLMSYNKRFHKVGGSISKGKSTLYHTQAIPKTTLQQADALLKTYYPELWAKYLSRYLTN